LERKSGGTGDHLAFADGACGASLSSPNAVGIPEDPSFFAVGVALGVHHQTVQRCVARAMTDGALAALEDRARPGREPVITQPARAWLIDLACRKAKELGYPHEVWTTRLLAQHAREHGRVASPGHRKVGLLQPLLAERAFRASSRAAITFCMGLGADFAARPHIGTPRGAHQRRPVSCSRRGQPHRQRRPAGPQGNSLRVTLGSPYAAANSACTPA
jgi:hypothetical protein